MKLKAIIMELYNQGASVEDITEQLKLQNFTKNHGDPLSKKYVKAKVTNLIDLGILEKREVKEKDKSK
jgi:hypothetical protein